mmetsp:Transcript_25539/g.64030  ORF Transcript_25539/g.64030 Transcript_25539/m.64030 type:complete len:143 (-) Transcript_25539:3832-4260(-)
MGKESMGRVHVKPNMQPLFFFASNHRDSERSRMRRRTLEEEEKTRGTSESVLLEKGSTDKSTNFPFLASKDGKASHRDVPAFPFLRTRGGKRHAGTTNVDSTSRSTSIAHHGGVQESMGSAGCLCCSSGNAFLWKQDGAFQA